MKFTIPCLFYPKYALKQIWFRLTKKSFIRRLNNDSILYFISMSVEFEATICFNVNGIICRRRQLVSKFKAYNLEKIIDFRIYTDAGDNICSRQQYVPRVPAWIVAGDNMCRDDNICRHGLNLIRISKGFTNNDDSAVFRICIIFTQSNWSILFFVYST